MLSVIYRRYVTNETFFEDIVEKAYELSDVRTALGGNAPVMATHFWRAGFDVLLGSTVSDELMKMIPEDIKGTCRSLLLIFIMGLKTSGTTYNI